MTSTEPALSLTEQQRDFAAAYLALTRDELTQVVASLSSAQTSFRSEGGTWSVAEIVEHLALIEGRIHRLIAGLPEAPPDRPGPAGCRDRRIHYPDTSPTDFSRASAGNSPAQRAVYSVGSPPGIEGKTRRNASFAGMGTLSAGPHFAASALRALGWIPVDPGDRVPYGTPSCADSGDPKRGRVSEISRHRASLRFGFLCATCCSSTAGKTHPLLARSWRR